MSLRKQNDPALSEFKQLQHEMNAVLTFIGFMQVAMILSKLWSIIECSWWIVLSPAIVLTCLCAIIILLFWVINL